MAIPEYFRVGLNKNHGTISHRPHAFKDAVAEIFQSENPV
jgi:hypothetical protein